MLDQKMKRNKTFFELKIQPEILANGAQILGIANNNEVDFDQIS